MSSLPVISLKGLRSSNLQERLATAAELGHACRDVGFFYVTDHDIPLAVCKGAFDLARQVFALPADDKAAMSIRRSPHNRGYVAMADEKLNPESGADMKEAFNIGTDFPEGHPDVLAGKPFRGVNFWPPIEGWREQALNYFDHCLELGRTIHRGFSLDLGLSEDFFAQHLTLPIATLRMLRYPPTAGSTDREDGGAGTHSDYGNITILATDEVAGLEVLNRKGEWIQAPHVPGAFVCNIGDCLMRWSNDVYVSTPHRVRPPARERYAIAFFLEVNPASVIDPRDVMPDQVPKYEPVTCAEYLAARLNATYDHRQAET
ncbi:isopenicillin N synthase family dioxygenase [Marinobacter sp. ANT_B65]|uniref:isopenicillin N synthase family dioxygenase n=1 Tax=Marinobacter sp. ANT_B65 TaxID=2039467 RepID=UPI000BBEB5CE|nr:2-oxoglutarate and iron-dependent oxygenase domain-containing protein [Marinobacter sp. ANT_B65]PCM44662.1 2OG-Fe(II) oxygenase [Marinobacter sp. ANT_B65]